MLNVIKVWLYSSSLLQAWGWVCLKPNTNKNNHNQTYNNNSLLKAWGWVCLEPNTVKNKHNQSYKILRNIEFTFTLAYSVLIKIAYFKY